MTKFQWTRIIPTAGLALSLGLFAAGTTLLPSSAEAGDKNACTSTKFAFKSVEKACKDGGRKAVKKIMKKAVKDARKAGKKMTCMDCHKDLKSFERTPNAVKDLKPYMK